MASPTASLPSRARIELNIGTVLLRLAETYPTIALVIYEIVQNALDINVNATRIWIKLNLKTRALTIRDNGHGTTKERFNAALASVGTEKRKGKGSLGQFGLGLISPLGKCDRFVFTSAPRSGPHAGMFEEWTFDSKKIVAQERDLDIPVRPRPDLTMGEPVKGQTHVEWCSEMVLHGIGNDVDMELIDLGELIVGIQNRFSATMSRNGVSVSIEIVDENGKSSIQEGVKAKEFQGSPLPVVVYNDADAGKVSFRLFAAPQGNKGRNGRVVVGVLDDDFRFPLHLFARSVETSLGLDEILAVLTSGMFEGEILVERATLQPNRAAFVRDAAHFGLCTSLETWYKEAGAAHFASIKASKQEERHQSLGLKSMAFLENILKNPANAGILKVIKAFGRGSIGAGHARVPARNIDETQIPSSMSVHGGGKQPREADGGATGGESRHPPQTEHPGHVPLTVSGPKGQVRKLVKSSSFGLRFAYSAMEGYSELWHLDTELGVLTFNIRHPHWEACDHRDSDVMALQETVTMQALTLETLNPSTREIQRYAYAELMHLTVDWITSRPGAKIMKGGVVKKK